MVMVVMYGYGSNVWLWSFWLRAGLAPQPFIFGYET